MIISVGVVAKTGTLSEWIVEFNSCFNNAINNNRQTLSVKKTRENCQAQTQNRYQLTDKDARFVATVKPISQTQNKITMGISTETGEKSFSLVYNGVCTDLEDPIKAVMLSAKDIADKLIADLNLDPDKSECLLPDHHIETEGFSKLIISVFAFV